MLRSALTVEGMELECLEGEGEADSKNTIYLHLELIVYLTSYIFILEVLNNVYCVLPLHPLL